jgi:hypothetical protein
VPYRLRITAKAAADSLPPVVGVRFGDAAVGELQLTTEWKTFEIVMPEGALEPGENTFRFEYSRPRNSGEVSSPGNGYGTAVRFDTVEVEPIETERR